MFLKFGLTPAALFYFIFGAVLIAISFIDLDHQIIPDRLSIPGIFIFSLSCVFIPRMTISSVLFGILTGGGILYVVALTYYFLRGRQGMGGGYQASGNDWRRHRVKGVFFTVFTGSVLGTVGGVTAMALAGKQNKRQAKIPFGPFLSAGALLYIFWGDPLIRWYLGF